MSVIAVRAPIVRSPEIPRQIKPYWLNRGLVYATMGDGIFWTRAGWGGRPAQGGGPKLRGSPWGVAQGFGATFGAGTTDWLVSPFIPAAIGVFRSTVVCLNAIGQGGGGLGRVFQPLGSATNDNGDSVYVSTVSGSIYLYNVGVGGGTIDQFNGILGATGGAPTTLGGAYGQWHVVGWTHDRRTFRAANPLSYWNGNPAGCNVNGLGGGSSYPTAPYQLSIGNRNTDNARTWDGMHGPQLIFDHAQYGLTPDEHRLLAENPNRIFEDEIRLLCFSTSGAAVEYEYEGSGGIEFGGTADNKNSDNFNAAGGIDFAGEADIEFVQFLTPEDFMRYVRFDRVKESAPNPADGPIVLAGAVVGHRAFGDLLADNDSCDVVIKNASGTEWEVANVIYDSSSNSLIRYQPPYSSSTDDNVEFTGEVTVWIDLPADRSGWLRPIDIAITGELQGKIAAQIVTPRAIQLEDEIVVEPIGKWIDRFQYGENALTEPSLITIVFNDLGGVQGTFDMRGSGTLTSIGLPTLQFARAFVLQQLSALDTVDVSLLRYAGYVHLQSLSLLPEIDLSELIGIMFFGGTDEGSGLFVQDNGTLEGITAPALSFVRGPIEISSLPSMLGVDFPALEFVGGAMRVTIANSILLVNMPQLVFVQGDITLSDLPNVTAFDFSSLEKIEGGLLIDVCILLESIEFPQLTGLFNTHPDADGWTIAIGFSAVDVADLESVLSVEFPLLEYSSGPILINNLRNNAAVNLSSLKRVEGGGITFDAQPELVTFAFGSGLEQIAGDVVMAGTVLDESSVDGVLVSLADLDGSGSTAEYSGLTVNLAGGCAPPSAIGLAAKVILEGRGNTVLVN